MDDKFTPTEILVNADIDGEAPLKVKVDIDLLSRCDMTAFNNRLIAFKQSVVCVHVEKAQCWHDNFKHSLIGHAD
jgi:hypothetical protein